MNASHYQVGVVGQAANEAVKGAPAGQPARLNEPTYGPECGVVLQPAYQRVGVR